MKPPQHLSAGAAEYLVNPDVLDYPTDWTDAAQVQQFRDLVHPQWAEINETVTFEYSVVDDEIAGVPVQRISVGTPSTGAVVMHLHGGMYCLGTPEIDYALNAPLARATGMEIVSVDYRLAPEHVFPAALDDAVAVHRALTDGGKLVALYGESAGGGLALSCALALRDGGYALPGRLALMSPMLDLTGSSDTYRTLIEADPDYGDPAVLLDPGAAYAAQTPLDDPLVSPLFAALHDLPPTLVQVGNREVLLGDSTRFARKARLAGNVVQLHVQDAGWHNYPLWHGVPEADSALDELARFLGEVQR